MLRLIDKSLFKAVRSGTVDVDFIMFLLKSGASPDCQNEFGRCPLLEMLTFVITEIGMEDFILSYPNVLKAAEILAENMKGEPKLTHFFVDLQQKYNRACKNREKLEEFEAEFEEQVNKIIDMLESKQDKTNVNLVNNKSSIVITEEYVKKCLENGEVSYSQKYDLFLAVLRDNGISENCLQILLDSGVRPEPDLLVRELFAKAHNQVRVDSRSKYVEYVNLSIKKLEYLVDKKLVDIDAVLLSHQGSFDDCSYSDFEYGYSAIMLAMKYGWIDIVKMLKAKGANLNIVADDGYVIADLLQSDEFEEKIEDLKQHGVLLRLKKNSVFKVSMPGTDNCFVQQIFIIQIFSDYIPVDPRHSFYLLECSRTFAFIKMTFYKTVFIRWSIISHLPAMSLTPEVQQFFAVRKQCGIFNLVPVINLFDNIHNKTPFVLRQIQTVVFRLTIFRSAAVSAFSLIPENMIFRTFLFHKVNYQCHICPEHPFKAVAIFLWFQSGQPYKVISAEQ